jgi:hypothetical protein
MTDEYGNDITVTYKSDNKTISTISDETGYVITLETYETGTEAGYLKKASDNKGNTSTFYYSQKRLISIISSDNRLLELVLSRFTIAKIASKVTAISPTDCMKIFDESGIDLTKYNGIYAPMAGFGGIIDGYVKWMEKNDQIAKNEVISGVEAYDINKSFCDWYGWEQRDMLESIIETDKVCVVCPPFGKNYEHWVDDSEKGLSQNIIDDMADITFIEWYDLIKKHVKAPAYIIIGPELSSNGRDTNKCSNLFKKRVGIQLWTDDLYERFLSKEERINEGIKE